jgi:hypothetical protein
MVKSEIIKEIEKTTEIKEKFSFWSYMKNLG